MKQVWMQIVPFDKKLVTLALESGVDGVVVEAKDVDAVRSLGRCTVKTPADFAFVPIEKKADEKVAVDALKAGKAVVLAPGWEIIPVENILAQADGLLAAVRSLDEARVAAGVLERGVDGVVMLPEGAADLKRTVAELKLSQGTLELSRAVVTSIETAGLGHRVCVDTMSMLTTGQGMLVGNSSAFTFLVNAETEDNPYVAARPFRINAGAVHAYAAMPGDRTNYLEELRSGSQVLIVAADGATTLATVGRVKVEVRPMLLIKARVGDEATGAEGAVFLQNAETIRVVGANGKPISVVGLKPGDEILVRTDQAGRHFGMRIAEEIKEG
ncbi:MAG: 3-dehydroquinate synthase II family protein [Desulfovibrionaceae bacterium]|jgi:3-dehydroquinate synthase II|nr:3-dehydroquinate synthase II family protein [Desulfovibrionaceae bacterium]